MKLIIQTDREYWRQREFLEIAMNLARWAGECQGLAKFATDEYSRATQMREHIYDVTSIEEALRFIVDFIIIGSHLKEWPDETTAKERYHWLRRHAHGDDAPRDWRVLFALLREEPDHIPLYERLRIRSLTNSHRPRR